MRLGQTILLQLVTVVCLSMTFSAQKTREFKLEPLSPKFSELIGLDSKLETVATGFGFTEGPMWDPAGFLYVCDETINKIFRVYPNGKKEELIALGDPDEIPFDRFTRLLDYAGNVRLLTRELTQPNGLAFSPNGRKFYVDDSEQRNIRVYNVAADGS